MTIDPAVLRKARALLGRRESLSALVEKLLEAEIERHKPEAPPPNPRLAGPGFEEGLRPAPPCVN